MKSVPFLVLFCALSATAEEAYVPFSEYQTQTHDFDSSGLMTLVIDNTSGSVTVRASKAKAEVKTTKLKADRTCKVIVERSGDILFARVEAGGHFIKSDCPVDFDISVPKNISIHATTSSGHLQVNGTRGDLSFKTSSGSIDADGEFSKLEGINESGTAKVSGFINGGSLRTRSGSITLAFKNAKPKGELEIRSNSGLATVFFPKGSKVKTNFSTASGKLMNEIGDSPEADFRLNMKASSGSLNVKQL